MSALQRFFRGTQGNTKIVPLSGHIHLRNARFYGNVLQISKALGLDNPFLLAHESVTGKHASIRGKDVISFTSFDYLGLTSHPAVTSAAKTAIDQFGCGATASRMVGGNTTLLNALDKAIADFIGTERATAFPMWVLVPTRPYLVIYLMPKTSSFMTN